MSLLNEYAGVEGRQRGFDPVGTASAERVERCEPCQVPVLVPQPTTSRLHVREGFTKMAAEVYQGAEPATGPALRVEFAGPPSLDRARADIERAGYLTGGKTEVNFKGVQGIDGRNIERGQDCLRCFQAR